MIKHHRSTPFFFPIVVLLLLLCSPAGATAKSADAVAAPGSGHAVWAWAGTSGGEDAVFISRQVGLEWEEPQKISANEGVNIVPSAINTSAEGLMVVWSTFTGNRAQLHYRQLKNGEWTEEKEFYTGLTSNMAPSVGVDGFGKIWLVWAGFNGISDEIYYSSWNGTAFATAKAMTANGVPDIQPVLGIDELTGTPWVEWQHYSESGYVKFISSWNGSAWSEPVPASAIQAPPAATQPPLPVAAIEKTTPPTKRVLLVKKSAVAGNAGGSGNQTANAEKTDEDLEIEIPAFVTNPDSATIHIPGHAVQSLPVRSVMPGK